MNVPEDQKLYGYHRLDDPLVSTAHEWQYVNYKKIKTRTTRTIRCNS